MRQMSGPLDSERALTDDLTYAEFSTKSIHPSCFRVKQSRVNLTCQSPYVLTSAKISSAF